jgi:TonB-dependent SusC/RagA subfamily outer membrane receptor
MYPTLYYLLQVLVCSAVLMVYYLLVLRNKKFHQYNRFYLLGVALVSWMVPLIKIVWEQERSGVRQVDLLTVVAANNSEMEAMVTSQQQSLDWVSLLPNLYMAVCIFLLSAMLVSLYRIYKIYTTHECSNLQQFYLVMTREKGTPFSFFSYIFWNAEIDIQTPAGKQILQHELTHVTQYHSIDKIVIQLNLIAGWFNPFFWLLEKELDMIHEFIADKKSVEHGDTASLAQMLLTTAYPGQQFPLTNPFFFSPIKRRLKILTSTKNPTFNYLRRLIVLPLLAVVVLLFAFRAKENTNTIVPLSKTYTVVLNAGHGGEDKGAIAADGTTEAQLSLEIVRQIQALNKNEKIKLVLTRDADVMQSVVAVSEFANAQSPDLFVSIHLNNIEGTSANKTKYEGAEIYMAAKDKAVDYDANYKLANNLAATLQEVATPFNGVKTRNKGIWVLEAVQCPSALIEAGYLSNNKELAKIKDADYQQKLAASILKGIENYLIDQERGASDVVKDTTKKVMIVQGYKISPEDTLIASKGNNKSVVIRMDGAGTSSNGQKPLFILDGEVISESVMKVIDPNKIESINILKDASAIAVFGEKGKGGVVQITTKKGGSEDAEATGRIVVRGVPLDNSKVLEERVLIISDTVQLNGKTVLLKSNNLKDVRFMENSLKDIRFVERSTVEAGKKSGVTFSVGSDFKESPSLIFVDGEKKTKKEMDALSPDQIKSVEILKGESAIKAYGTEAKDGVIKITTKKKVNL